MSWPTTPIPTVNLSVGTALADDARSDLLSAVQALNNIMAARTLADGIASLGADGTVPATQLNGTSIISAVAADDGSGSGLDADLLDGIEATGFVHADGSVGVAIGTAATAGQVLSREVAATTGSVDALIVQATTSGTAAIGLGAAINFKIEDDAGTASLAATLAAIWSDPVASSLDSYASLSTVTAGTVEEALRVEARHVELFNSTQANTPASGSVWLYAKADAIYYKTSGGVEVGPLASATGGASHGALTGLGADDHTQYLLADGTRTMTGELTTGTNAVLASELSVDPTTPAAGDWKLYFKAGGLYHIDDAGVVTLVAAPGGSIAHSTLTGLLADDHPQYLLRQPAADVTINDLGSDFDFTIKGNASPFLFNLDALQDAIGINFSGTMLGRLHAVGAATLPAVYGTVTGGGDTALFAATSGTAVHATATLGSAGAFARSLAGGTGAVLSVDEQNATAATVAVQVDHAGTGSPMVITSAGVQVLDVGASELHVNGGSGAYDVRCEGATAPYLFNVQASNEMVTINTATGSGRLTVVGGALDGVVGSSTDFGKSGVVGSNVSGAGVSGSSTDGTGISGSSTTGRAGHFVRNATSPATQAVVEIEASDAADSENLLKIIGHGTGDYFHVVDNLTTIWRFTDGKYIEWGEINTDPTATPSTGNWFLYFKPTGLFAKSDTGGVIGPFGATGSGGGSAAGIDTSLQYNNAGLLGGASSYILANSATDLHMRNPTVVKAKWNPASEEVRFSDNWEIFWVDTAAADTGTADVALSRGGANRLQVTNAAAGWGDLDLNEVRLRGSTSGAIALQSPAIAGGSFTYLWPSGAPTAGYVLSTDATGIMSWVAGGGGGVSTWLALTDTPGTFTAGALPYANGAASALLMSAGLTYDGTDLSITGAVKLLGSTSGSIALAAPAAPTVTAYTLPTADGTAGQVLATDGAGVLSWITGSGGGLPTGAAWHTLRHDGTSWIDDAFLLNSGSAIGIGAAPTVNESLFVFHPFTATASNQAVRIDAQYTPSTSGASSVYGVASTSSIRAASAAGSAESVGLLGIATSESTSSAAGCVGLRGTAKRLGSGTLTYLSGVDTQVVNNVVGTVTDAYGLHILTPTNAGTITNLWGLYQDGTEANSLGGALQIRGATSGYVGLAAPATPTPITYTLPTADGTTGQVLSTNGAGVLSWVTGSGGGVTTYLGLTDTPSSFVAAAIPYTNAGATALLHSAVLAFDATGLLVKDNQIRSQNVSAETKWFVNPDAVTPVLKLASDVPIIWRNAVDAAGGGIDDVTLERSSSDTPKIIIGDGAGGYGRIRHLGVDLHAATSGFRVRHQAATSVAADVAYTWPGAPGVSNQDLTSDGVGTLTWLTRGEHTSANGGVLKIAVSEVLLSDLSVSATATGALPANSIILGVTARTTVSMTGATGGADIGLSGGPQVLWGTLAPTVGSTIDGNIGPSATLYRTGASTEDIVLVGNGGAFTAGAARLVIHYIQLTAPTA